MKANDLTGTDDLDQYTELHRQNYLFESDFLIREVPIGASVLQIGSMDGVRAIGLLQTRPDISFTGLDIEPELLDVASKNAAHAGVTASFVTGDVLDPPSLGHFDYVVCLNNTLSYVSDPDEAIPSMQRLGTTVVLSVFTEAFDIDEASAYYDKLGLQLKRVEDDCFVMADGWRIHRFSSRQVHGWDGVSRPTPLGVFMCLGNYS